jgi:hypothetical protein
MNQHPSNASNLALARSGCGTGRLVAAAPTDLESAALDVLHPAGQYRLS